MKIFYLADGASIHTKKWVFSLLDAGHRIHLFSLNPFNEQEYRDHSDKFSHTTFSLTHHKTKLGGLNKLGYLKVVTDVKNSITEFKPDIVHAHFASSYGLLGVKAGFHPLIISVWGYDVFHFPGRSFIHKNILKNNLSKADKILSTSHVMAKETNKYSDKIVEVTPFGIDTELFKADDKVLKSSIFPFNDDDLIIGTAKPLENKYAIDHLIQAFARLAKKHPDLPLKLCIAGKGSIRDKLDSLVEKLGIEKNVYFAGQLAHDKIPGFLNALDIFAALSLEESFGVAVIEAGACEKPVVVSDEGGLPEVVENNVTGFIVPKGDIQAASDALEKLIINTSLREQFGQAARTRVKKLYDWNVCVRQMLNIYQDIVSTDKKDIEKA
jgi:L-malate glycosyltransferase